MNTAATAPPSTMERDPAIATTASAPSAAPTTVGRGRRTTGAARAAPTPNTPDRTIALTASDRCGMSQAATSATNEPSSASEGRGTERRRSAPRPNAASDARRSVNAESVER